MCTACTVVISGCVPPVLSVSQVVYRLYPDQDPEVMEKFSVSTQSGGAVLSLVDQLDYETRSLYEVVVEARDRAGRGHVNTATATVIVKVRPRTGRVVARSTRPAPPS